MRIVFEQINNISNPRSIHGIYPYRGKISSLEADMIIKQLPKDSLLLDPFCGSGTIVYEAKKYGIKSIGIDLNPIAIDIAKGKINLINNSNVLEEATILVNKAKNRKKVKLMPSDAIKHFHEETAEEIMRLKEYYNEMSDYLKACFYGAIALSARGCNGYKWTSSTVGKDIKPKNKIDFYAKFLLKVKKHNYPTNDNGSAVYLHDSRRISEIIKPNSIDYVFTSPPYFDCLDYTAYYGKIIYSIFDKDRVKIKKTLIQNYISYKKDMKLVLDELYLVCKKGATIIFVVGDKKIHGKLINGANFFNEISPFKKIDLIERNYKNSSSQVFDKLNKTERKEQIIIWTK